KLCCLGSLSGWGGDHAKITTGYYALGNGYIGIVDKTQTGTETGSATANGNTVVLTTEGGQAAEIAPAPAAAGGLPQGIKIVGERRVGTAEMIASTLRLLGGAASRSETYEVLVLADLVAEGTVKLIVPVA